ncbi:MAG: hypothetical protein BalsKO_08620 [Balneolaceae bacterium]
MKKLLSLFILLAISAFSAKAQINESVTATVNITTQMVQSIELITVKTMSFGSVQPGQQEIYVNPVSDVNSGYMIAVGTPGAEFRLDYFQERTLFNTSGGQNLTFEYEISANEIEDQASSELLDFNARSLTFTPEGVYHIWVGGRVNIENAEPGNYEGDFTIEIDYI